MALPAREEVALHDRGCIANAGTDNQPALDEAIPDMYPRVGQGVVSDLHQHDFGSIRRLVLRADGTVFHQEVPGARGLQTPGHDAVRRLRPDAFLGEIQGEATQTEPVRA